MMPHLLRYFGALAVLTLLLPVGCSDDNNDDAPANGSPRITLSQDSYTSDIGAAVTVTAAVIAPQPLAFIQMTRQGDTLAGSRQENFSSSPDGDTVVYNYQIAVPANAGDGQTLTYTIEAQDEQGQTDEASIQVEVIDFDALAVEERTDVTLEIASTEELTQECFYSLSQNRTYNVRQAASDTTSRLIDLAYYVSLASDVRASIASPFYFSNNDLTKDIYDIAEGEDGSFENFATLNVTHFVRLEKGTYDSVATNGDLSAAFEPNSFAPQVLNTLETEQEFGFEGSQGTNALCRVSEVVVGTGLEGKVVLDIKVVARP
jgi:hypothetical protein